MNHYVYRLDHMETGGFYIGSRSCNCHPSMDNYMGSMSRWKPDKNKLIKTIIKDDFLDRIEATLYESETIRKYIKNPLNMNFNIPGKDFHSLGMVTVIDSGGKTFQVFKDDEDLLNGVFRPLRKGKKHTEESKKKMSDSAKNRKISKEKENERRKNISKTMKGVPKTKEFCDNMSKTRLGENNPYLRYLKSNNRDHPGKGKKYEKMECPHCKRMIAKSIIKVKHLDNCKNKNNEQED